MMRIHAEHASQCDGVCFDDRGEWHAALVSVATRLMRRAEAAESERDAAVAHSAELTRAVAAMRDRDETTDAIIALYESSSEEAMRTAVALDRFRAQVCLADVAARQLFPALPARGADGWPQDNVTTIAFVAEIAALRAIIEGSTTPPTDAEIAAHETAGGAWTCITVGEWIFSDSGMDGEAARGLRSVLEANGWATPRWWALDSTRRPCAWPVGDESEGA